MAKWFYYNDDSGAKIEVTGGQLKGLAKAGMITPDTIVENEDGKKARAGKVKGLAFVVTARPVTSQPAESEIYGLAQPTPPVEVNPFTDSVPEEVNPFTVAPSAEVNPFTTVSSVAVRQIGGKYAISPLTKAVLQRVATPVAKTNESAFDICIIWTLALLVVGGIGWAAISSSSSITFTAAEQAEIDEFVAEFGNNVRATDETYGTLLHRAAIFGYLPVVKYLVSRGANVNAKSEHGQTPLHAATHRGGQIEIVRFLVSQGANVRAKDNDGDTALDLAKEYGIDQPVIKYLSGLK